MKVAVFSTKPYDRRFLERANAEAGHELHFFEPRLNEGTLPLAAGFDAVCAFVNDDLGRDALAALARGGTRLIALRCAGFNNVDLAAADGLGLTVLRVPAYSPHSVAEHTVALMLALNRKIHRAYNRVREGNFSIDGLLGFDFRGRTAGIVGTGRIGRAVVQILAGFGCRLIAHDVHPNPDCERLGVTYTSLDELLAASDVITLHCPLTPDTHHMIDDHAIGRMRDGAMLINTSRGALVDTDALIRGLKSGRFGSVGLDVYEEEADVFFEDLSEQVLHDDQLARLLTFPNVIVTSHQAFFTHDAMTAIAETTIGNISGFERGRIPEDHRVTSR